MNDPILAYIIATPVVITIAYFIYWYFFKEEDLDDYMVYTTYNQSAKRKLTTV